MRVIIKNSLAMTHLAVSGLMVLMGIIPQEMNRWFEEFRVWMFGGLSHPDHLAMVFTPLLRIFFIATGLVGIIFNVVAMKMKKKF